MARGWKSKGCCGTTIRERIASIRGSFVLTRTWPAGLRTSRGFIERVWYGREKAGPAEAEEAIGVCKLLINGEELVVE